MTLLVLGLNHRTAPLELRERLTIDSEQLPAALDALARQVAPGVILSTCNRLEIYTLANASAYPPGDTPSPDAADDLLWQLQQFAAGWCGVPLAQLLPHCYHYREEDCVRHLFRVASGLDSMVAWEWEILGQVRAAFSAASVSSPGETPGGAVVGEARAGGVRGPLSRLFHQALRVGQRVRPAADIGAARRRSVSQVSVQLAHRLLGDLSRRQVLIIGAGDTGQLAGRALAEAGAGNLVVTNRTYGRAKELSGELGGVAAPFERLYQTLADADAVISTTASPNYLLRRPQMQEVMEERGGRPLLLIDIAVPRDIDPAVGLLEGVRLCDIDALRSLSDAGNSALESETARAEELVAEETARFMNWWDSLDTISTIASLRQYAENLRQVEVNKTLNRLKRRWASGVALSSAHDALAEPLVPSAASGPMDDAPTGLVPAPNTPDANALAAQLDAMTSALVKKLLHHPTVFLRETRDPTRQRMVMELFNLDGEDGPHGRR